MGLRAERMFERLGTRLAYGQNFVVALDGARSSEGTAIYIGLGYPF